MVTSAVGTLPFDGAIATVDDFHVGEEVAVSLRPSGSSFDVIAVVPVVWRRPDTPPPLEALRTTTSAIDRVVRGRGISLGSYAEDALTIDVDVDSYAPPQRVVFSAVAFLQIPSRMDEVAALSAFDGEAFVANDAALVQAWPKLARGAIVFRFEPASFGESAGYVVARSVTLG